jgi:hypothetical protein
MGKRYGLKKVDNACQRFRHFIIGLLKKYDIKMNQYSEDMRLKVNKSVKHYRDNLSKTNISSLVNKKYWVRRWWWGN